MLCFEEGFSIMSLALQQAQGRISPLKIILGVLVSEW